MKTTTSKQIMTVVLCNLLALSTSLEAKGRDYRVRRRNRLQRTAQRKQQEVDSYDGILRDFTTREWFHPIEERKFTAKSCGTGKGASCAPSNSPTEPPSPGPTVSAAPSAPPTPSPSRFPTLSPSLPPTFTPSVSPAPSSTPSKHPTQEPSAWPSLAPTTSLEPSSHPTLLPTGQLYVTDGSTGLVSTCLVQPPQDTGVIQEQTVAFLYNLYTILDATFTEEIANMESALHGGLSREFLTCDYDSGRDFYIVAVEAQPDDSLDDVLCDTSQDPQPAEESKCGVVNAELTMTVYFPPSSTRRMLQTTDASPEVLGAAGDYLRSSMNDGDFDTDVIVQVIFQGFANTQDAGRETPPASEGGSGISAIMGNVNQPSNIADNKVAMGGAVLGLAAIVLVAFMVLAGRRRKRRREAFLKHLEGMSDSDMSFDQPPEALADGRVHLVLDDGGFMLDDSGFSSNVNESGEGHPWGGILQDLDATDMDRGHDVHDCNSGTCPVCRSMGRNPTFIRAPPLGSSLSDEKRLRKILEIRESYRSPDTVEL